MDEHFDIVPSPNFIPTPQTNPTDYSDIVQPSKRVKTTHGEEDSPNPPDTQLTQLPDGVRKIPGPAGSLRPIHITSAQSFPAKVEIQTEGSSQDGLLIQSKIHKKAPSVHTNGTQDDFATDFTRGPWLVMLQHSELPPFGISPTLASNYYISTNLHNKGATPSLLKYSIDHILENRRIKKIPRLVALVKAVVPTDADFRITLRDPTGEIDGALQRKAIELHPSIISGAVIVLEQVCSWW
jgi:hypothetical protein